MASATVRQPLKDTRLIMGMPVTIEIVDAVPGSVLERIFDYFIAVDERYSTYKPASEISRINDGLPERAWSPEMRRVLALCEATKQATGGYFDIRHGGKLDPSGLVKGWAIHQAAKRLRLHGARNFYIEAGGDIQTRGHNGAGEAWRVGIRNPFHPAAIIKRLAVSGQGVATSGIYERGRHIYDPHTADSTIDTVTSLTVVGPNIYEADRFATAAFAMGRAGLDFIESLPGLEGYLIHDSQTAVFTSGFERYVLRDA